MAVLPSVPQKPPTKPMSLEVKVRPDKGLHIRWQVGEDTHHRFQVEVCYFEFEGPIIDPFHSTGIIEVEKCTAFVRHPEEVPRDQACAVKVVLRAVYEDGLLSEAVQKQVAWDAELSVEETIQDLKQRVAEFEQKDFASFVADPHIVVVAAQHHGKSSHINHLSRCLHGDLTLNDHMDQAPASEEEKTVALKSLRIPLGSSHMVLVDTPAFPNMNDEMQGKLKTLLSTGVKDGARRQDLAPEKQSSFSKPPHGAIVVVSLCHWRDQKTEMHCYLQKMAGVFKTASGGTVEFPYVVVVTFLDEFLRDCPTEDPSKELESALEGIKRSAKTDHVYAVTNYKRNSSGSLRSNKATFDLLSQLLEKAMRENTATPVQEWASAASTLVSRVARPLNHPDIHQPPPHRWPKQVFGNGVGWKSVGFALLLVGIGGILFGLIYKVAMQQQQLDKHQQDIQGLRDHILSLES